MPLEKFDGLELPAPADFHVHLRDGEMMNLVTPTIRRGGNNMVFVMVGSSRGRTLLYIAANWSVAKSHTSNYKRRAVSAIQESSAKHRTGRHISDVTIFAYGYNT